MSKRNDPNKKRVKEYLFNRYGCYCMVCEKHFKRHELQLHHIIKFEHSHTTTVNDSSLVCDKCHQEINRNELHNKTRYTELNIKIKTYKATH